MNSKLPFQLFGLFRPGEETTITEQGYCFAILEAQGNRLLAAGHLTDRADANVNIGISSVLVECKVVGLTGSFWEGSVVS